MKIIVDNVLQHLESSLSAEFDYRNVHEALDFLFRKSLNDSHTENTKVALSSVEAVLEKVWESFHTGSWADAPDGMRKLYSHASLLKTKLLLKTANDERMLKKTIKAIDMGLLMGNAFRNELTIAASLLCKALQQTFVEVPVKLCDYSKSNNNSYAFHRIGDHVPILHQPSLETFLRDYLKSKKPIKITGNMEHWPAINKWKDLNYLIKLAGARLVPVEIGSSYADADWSQKLITLEEFINIHVVQEGEKSTYLAQHQLFNQIPELKDDIRVPEYCYLADVDGEEPDINAWLGPKGTVSPTHYDPKNNFLAQVVGSKYIILYDPKWSEYLYPYDDKFLKNTAQVDPVKPDFCQFPNFSHVKAMHCILNEGEMLFIPSGWWHRVESLSVSFSVSFWWM
ncbi:bifunctional peptidase and arginyl-hydroxylase JMJD5 isoform X1 [Aphis gossypii]|uniref:bifunctional peptidase and arginyl-hydroxylase JMJD5 isoform X1 n=1 Tax=Aphis gossypii TaxID=80765 RepID=UPI002159140C|nr:bifunctional peptidase and arginyl-hydroxylase JMJD5 isoform X1 [Aphis gossypii]